MRLLLISDGREFQRSTQLSRVYSSTMQMRLLHSTSRGVILQREVVVRTRVVLYEKTIKLILSIKSFRGIFYRAKTFLGCLWCVSERGKTSPLHTTARRTPPHTGFAVYCTCQKSKTFLFPNFHSFSSPESKFPFSDSIEKTSHSSNQAKERTYPPGN